MLILELVTVPEHEEELSLQKATEASMRNAVLISQGTGDKTKWDIIDDPFKSITLKCP